MKRILPIFFTLILASLITEAQGIYRMWGMTQAGGADNNGTIFSTDYAGNNFTQRYQFNIIKNAGAYPQESDLTELNGKFYSMTSQGGEAGMGVIFEWDPVTNIYTKKIDFNGSNGSYPHGSLTAFNGKLYGLAQSGGLLNYGILFEWDPVTNIFTKKIDFLNASNGTYPLGNLSLANGKLYGMTYTGGSYDNGCIFEWDPASNTLVNKISLNYPGGCRPYGNSLTLNSNGKFYGMTTSGGVFGKGCIFEWDPASNIFQEKIDFDGLNGGIPSGNLYSYNGKYYGMTRFGGTTNNGVLFEWDPALNQYTVKISFSQPTNGSEPTGSLNFYNGKFYGLAHDGGTGGTLFEWDPVTNTCLADVMLDDSTGVAPYGSLFLSGGKFYGMTSNAGANFKGTLFEFDPAGNIFTKKLDFNGATSSKNPRGTLTQAGNKFYGVASQGGINNEGVIFEWSPSYPGYTKKIDCMVSEGSRPYSNPVLHNNRYYGSTSYGGDYFFGTLYAYNPDSVAYTKKVSFNGSNGSKPIGDLNFIGDKAYGLTSEGGTNGFGVIYEWDLPTNTLTKKFDFDTYNGSTPMGKLVLYNGKFYGMAQVYCSSNVGCIFEWDPASNIFTKKVDFYVFGGGKPTGSLSMYNGRFYGLASYGGSNFGGAIFEWDPATNELNTKINLTPAQGTEPNGSLTLSNNKFYGVTNTGGSDNLGVVFEWDPNTNDYTVKKNFTGADGANPSYGNDLAKYPVPVAPGMANTCTSFPSVTIDNTNNNVWVPITDNQGNAVVEIKANGNNLGVINTSVYINAGPVREDASNRLYLDRNLTITPAVQPTTAVNIRLYLTSAEYEALRTATNSLGQPSGINSINDVQFFKTNEGCVPALQNSVSPVFCTGEAWNGDYVLTATINSFSSFYVLKTTGIVPLTLLNFDARLQDQDGILSWRTENEINTSSFDAERSTDGITFTKAGSVMSDHSTGAHHYIFIDKAITDRNVPVVYYRLKIKDADGRFTYSPVVKINLSQRTGLLVYPNPAAEIITVHFTDPLLLHREASITNMAGMTVKKFVMNSFLQEVTIGELPAGIYFIKSADGSVAKIIKQ